MLCCCDGLQNRTRKRMSPDVVFVLSWKSCDGPQLDLHLCAVLCGHNLTLLLGSARLCLRCLSARFLSVVSGHWMKALPDVLQVHGDTNLTVVMVLVLLLLGSAAAEEAAVHTPAHTLAAAWAAGAMPAHCGSPAQSTDRHLSTETAAGAAKQVLA